ncbi:peptide-methionine (S)-S-oxide reductase MsrA [Pelomonas sp. SE-A7]|uniref:peptide-methionine (S)-S-oxide reductase MsrA n=1 Tax=Pelomonas sp. SE-A7 TaxID=3054953 RepID=UPI00259C9BB8|nr:peptide-methionine (S)-S-oxide reductase MsrA [Pelomonas sp. SE-A7]MDM4765117.1 peptide-methionine (S)-S-oxide reductase MsrA [Pelomonas sp. SE-A7]
MTQPLQRITLAGGCFWCTEAVYELVRGVAQVESGYAMGHLANPNYEQICSGNTGHAEVLRIDFDPTQVSLRELLEVFFVIHDPTTLNRQGADVGTQYRSGIYFHSPEQETVCRQVLDEANEAHHGRVVTELLPIRDYWPAEAYHQHYYARHPEQGYCAFVVAGKVEKFHKTFARLMKNGTA